jgi:hypothetical protein
VTDLATWLLDRIAEDEAVARAADPGPWKGDTSVKSVCVVFDRDGEWITNVVGRQIPRGLVAFDQDVPNTAHIARHDPARVLAECAAKRRIVNAWLLAESYTGSEVNDALFHGLDRTLRLLALPYAACDGYDPSWGVQ